jgi:coenzyme F420-0:L-glutamate ligase / coenzyme F420-1:gamma-L-glutamate ligase
VLTIRPVTGLPEVVAGADLAGLIADAADLRDEDVVVVAQKVVSKAEGALVRPRPGESRAEARRRLARDQAARVLADAPHALIVETVHGLVCANAGIDASNVPDGALALLPADPDASARRIRDGLRSRGFEVAVVVSDTFGRPWRLGQTDVAIGCAGLAPIRDERGGADRQGVELTVTETCVADELAGAADLARRKADGVPAVVIRGYAPELTDIDARTVRRPLASDLFPRGRGGLADALARDRGVPTTPVPTPELDRAVGAAGRAGRGQVAFVTGPSTPDTPTTVEVRGPQMESGAAAATLVAALVDLGFEADLEPPGPDRPDAAAVVVAGRTEPATHPRR